MCKTGFVHTLLDLFKIVKDICENRYKVLQSLILYLSPKLGKYEVKESVTCCVCK